MFSAPAFFLLELGLLLEKEEVKGDQEPPDCTKAQGSPAV